MTRNVALQIFSEMLRKADTNGEIPEDISFGKLCLEDDEREGAIRELIDEGFISVARRFRIERS